MIRNLKRAQIGTAAEWSTENPILQAGEIGIALGVPVIIKSGDGRTPWNDLEPTSTIVATEPS